MTEKPSGADLLELASMAITAGMFDEQLPQLERLIHLRKDVIASELVASLNIGDKVTIAEHVRPKLLGGLRCEVTGFEGSSVKVRLLDYGSAKWRTGQTITLPRTLVGYRF